MKHFVFKSLMLLPGLILCTFVLHAQPYKFYYSNVPKFVKSSSDTLLYPFTGGLNSPQFSNIDLDNDGTKDLFVFDRTANKHLTFIRQGNHFVYAPQYEKNFPAMTDWALLKDYNGDGKEDIFTETTKDKSQLRDTSGYIYSNGLRVLKNVSSASGLKFIPVYDQVIDTGGWWTDFGVPRDPAAISMNRTDISAIEDFDGDGDLDLLCFNGVDFSPSFYENWTINDMNIPYSHDSLKFILRTQCWGGIQYDVNAFKNRFRLHQGKQDLASCVYDLWRDKQANHAGSTMLFLDMNHDGAKDMIYGDVGFTDLLLLVNGKNSNSHPHKQDSIASQDTMFPSNTVAANFIVFPAAYYVDIDNDQVNEMLVTTNNTTGAKSVNNVWIYENTGTNAQPVLDYAGHNFPLYEQTIDLGTKSIPLMIDIDRDGDQDLLVATNGDYEETKGLQDRLVWFENISSDSTQPVFSLKDSDFLQLSKDTAVLDMYPTFGDLNGDGKPDLILGDNNGWLTYYVNQSSGTTYSFPLQARRYAGINVGSYAAPQLVDLDKDGLLDLVIGCKDGDIKYYRNTGTATTPHFNSSPDNDSLGGVAVNELYLYNGRMVPYYSGYSTPHVCDFDHDGNYEMIVGSESGKIYLYTDVNAAPGVIFNRYDRIFVPDPSSTQTGVISLGGRSAPFVANIDGDVKYDVIVGNIRGGLSLLSSAAGPVGFSNLQDRVAGRVVVFPNPASDRLNFSMENINEDISYSIYNEVGKLVTGGKISRYHSSAGLSVSGFAPGLYFVTMKGNNGFAQTARVLIDR